MAVQVMAPTTAVFADTPAINAATAYCSGCRLMTQPEAHSWGCANGTVPGTEKCKGYYNGNAYEWWLLDTVYVDYSYYVSSGGTYYNAGAVTSSKGVRPVVSISSKTITSGSGTSSSPYVIQ